METATLTEEVTDSPTRDLTVQDRCDRCKAQAFYVGLLTLDNSELEILFCGHHGRNHTPALVEQGWTVLDFTARINEKPTNPDD